MGFQSQVEYEQRLGRWQIIPDKLADNWDSLVGDS